MKIQPSKSSPKNMKQTTCWIDTAYVVNNGIQTHDIADKSVENKEIIITTQEQFIYMLRPSFISP